MRVRITHTHAGSATTQSSRHPTRKQSSKQNRHVELNSWTAIRCGFKMPKYGTKTERLNCAVAYKLIAALCNHLNHFYKVSRRKKNKRLNERACVCAVAMCVRGESCEVRACAVHSHCFINHHHQTHKYIFHFTMWSAQHYTKNFSAHIESVRL